MGGPSNLLYLLALDGASLRTAVLLALLGAALLCSACSRSSHPTR